MEEVRCGRCGKKLAIADYRMLEIKCPRCGQLNHFELRAGSPEPERRERYGKGGDDGGEQEGGPAGAR